MELHKGTLKIRKKKKQTNKERVALTRSTMVPFREGHLPSTAENENSGIPVDTYPGCQRLSFSGEWANKKQVSCSPFAGKKTRLWHPGCRTASVREIIICEKRNVTC